MINFVAIPKIDFVLGDELYINKKFIGTVISSIDPNGRALLLQSRSFLDSRLFKEIYITES
jgi:hypothetical protein